MLQFRPVRVAMMLSLCSILTMMLVAGLHYVHAIEIPPGNGPSAFIQTNGPNAPLGSGDYYTNVNGGNEPHRIHIDVPCTWRANDNSVPPITVALYDPESFEDLTPPVDDRERLDPPAWDQIIPTNPRDIANADNTTYTLMAPDGSTLTTATFTPDGDSDGRWVELVTFVPDVDSQLCQNDASLTYMLETTTSDDDEQSWRLRVNHDPDCTVSANAPGSCSGIGAAQSAQLNNGNEVDDFDSLPGTGDELGIGLLQISYEHASQLCQNFFFFVGIDTNASSRDVTLHNFDMDNNGDITYFTASGRSIDGTLSGGSRWNGPGAIAGIPPLRVGDTIQDVSGADLGWWRAAVCAGRDNQYIFEGEEGEPVYFQQPPTPQMEVSKDDGNTVVQPGDVLTYTIAFTNTADPTLPSAGAATNVVLTDTIPDNATYQSCAFGPGFTGSCDINPANAREVIFELDGVVAAGQSGTVQVTVQVNPDADGDVVNEVQLVYRDILNNRFPPVSDEDINTIVPPPEIDATKVVEAISSEATGECEVLTGETLRYTVVVSNTGNADATGLVFTDTLDVNTTLVTGSVTTDQGSVTTGNAAGDTSIAVSIGTLGSGERVTITYDALVNDALPQPQTDIVNQGRVTGENTGTLLTDDPTTTTERDPTTTLACQPETSAPPLLVAAKTVTPLNSSATDECKVLVGEALLYEVIITNSDPVAATNVTYEDTLDPNTQLISGTLQISQGTVSSSISGGSTVISATIGQMNPNTSVTISYQARVNNTLPNDGPATLVNQGTVFWDDDNSIQTDDPAQPGDTDPTETLACPGLTAIELESFVSTWQGDTVRVRWVTTLENETWGFHLLRSSDGNRATAERVTDELILAKGRGQGGATYVWLDQDVEAGVCYTYWLEETELNGNTLEYGPASGSASCLAAQDDWKLYLPVVSR